MELEIKPEASAEEREAAETALRELGARGPLPAAYLSKWRAAGLREAVEDYALARPRKSDGATRA